jgi:hypothetical protein
MISKSLSSCLERFFATTSLEVFVILVVHKIHGIIHFSVLQIALQVSLTKCLLPLLLQHYLHILIEVRALGHDILLFFHRVLFTWLLS